MVAAAEQGLGSGGGRKRKSDTAAPLLIADILPRASRAVSRNPPLMGITAGRPSELADPTKRPESAEFRAGGETQSGFYQAQGIPPITPPCGRLPRTPGAGCDGYWLDVGTALGGGNLSNGLQTATAKTVTTLPNAGGSATVYVRLRTRVAGRWPTAYD